MTREPSKTIAWQPASRPLITVSATHDASAIATTASAAVPPSARISAPTAAVAGCPPRLPPSSEPDAQSQSILPGGAPEHWSEPERDVAQRPVDGEHPGEDRVAEHRAERAAVDRRRAVVAEQEVLLVRDGDRPGTAAVVMSSNFTSFDEHRARRDRRSTSPGPAATRRTSVRSSASRSGTISPSSVSAACTATTSPGSGRRAGTSGPARATRPSHAGNRVRHRRRVVRLDRRRAARRSRGRRAPRRRSRRSRARERSSGAWLLPFPEPQSRPRRASSFTRGGDCGVVY